MQTTEGKQLNTEKYLEHIKNRHGPNSERAYWCEQTAQMIRKPLKQVLGLTSHLPTRWIKHLYEDAQQGRKPPALWWYLYKKTK